MESFKQLMMWQKAHRFVLASYQLTENFPKSELFGLVPQFRRAAVSIAANIAEGHKKTGQADKLRFFNISQGSLEECRYYIILSKDLNYIDENQEKQVTELIEETSRLLNGYCKSIVTNRQNLTF